MASSLIRGAVLIPALLLEVRLQAAVTTILGQVTGNSVTVALRSDNPIEAYIEFGTAPGVYSAQTRPAALPPDPYASGFFASQTLLSGLQPNTRYYYRLQQRAAGSTVPFSTGTESAFHTQRPPGSTFVFGIQGDSHPERERNMFHPALYAQTLRAMAAEQPDFYLTSGDDFSVDTLRTPYTQASVTGRYTLQLPYLDLIARSAPLFLVTGNHEQTSLANYRLAPDADNSNQVPVWAQNAHNFYYPSPAPNDPNTGTFFSGNATTLPGIGLLRDYYAWEWGDALFAVIDPYWSSPVQVDSGLGGQNAGGNRVQDRWTITHGDAQYQWLKQTLESSQAKWKFVFAHHVMGSGRGGVEVARQFEWGGNNNNGTYGFPVNRPTWASPIHQLMAANKVTIFFQAHDHLFARQELDGVVYQSLPNPADNTYTAFNADAYLSGDVLPNSGYTKITVSPSAVKVDYIRQWLPEDTRPPSQVSGRVEFSYTIRNPAAATPVIASVNAAGGSSTIAPNTWIEIKGSNLAPAASARIWRDSDFTNNQLPTQLDGVSVTVNGRPAFIYYVSPNQVNALTPPGELAATAAVQVSVGGLPSPAFSAPAAAASPAFFSLNGTQYAAAVHTNGTLVGPATLFPGNSTPAKPGETILLFGNGFGATTVPVASGSLVQSGLLAPTPVITVGIQPAVVSFAGLVAPGQYQFNVTIPADAPDGDLSLSARHANSSTPPGTVITVRR